MTLSSPVIVNETKLSELVHEMTHARAGCADHFRQHFLTDLFDYHVRFSIVAVAGKQKQNSRQSLFTGVEQLIHQVFLNSDSAHKQMGQEFCREYGVGVQSPCRRTLGDPGNSALSEGRGGGYTALLAGKTALTKEIARS